MIAILHAVPCPTAASWGPNIAGQAAAMPPEPERTTLDSSELNLLHKPRRRHTRSPRMDRCTADIPKVHAEQKQNASATTRTRAAYYPALFTIMACSALAELGLTAFLVSAGNEHNTWPSPRYHLLQTLTRLPTQAPPPDDFDAIF